MTNATLAGAIEAHRTVTEAHRDRLDTLLEGHGAGSGDDHDAASVHAIIAEAGKWVDMIGDGELEDAGLIASLQRMEHYELAVAGALAAWSGRLGHGGDAPVLAAILEEDKSGDAHLTEIAAEGVERAAR